MRAALTRRAPGSIRRLRERLRPRLSHEELLRRQPGRCKFLQRRSQIDDCTAYVRWADMAPHAADCKNWDLAHVLPYINTGDVLDMGSSDSSVLENLALRGHAGSLHGIDLRLPNRPLPGVQYRVGDLCHTDYPDGAFQHVTCLSVIEHGVDLDALAAEAARILSDDGILYLTFDYWTPRLETDIELFGLPWTPLDAADVERLLEACAEKGLTPVGPVDWRIDQAVIRAGYHSPDPRYAYTFGLLTLRKGGRSE